MGQVYGCSKMYTFQNFIEEEPWAFNLFMKFSDHLYTVHTVHEAQDLEKPLRTIPQAQHLKSAYKFHQANHIII